MTQATTPFGRRPLSLAMVATQAAARDFSQAAEAGRTVAHKWRLFRALTEARTRLGVGDRALSVLHALLSFHQETALAPAGDGAGLVVFPSNRELSLRAHGMAPATLRRHLAALVEAGLIIRRDSANGKRFARRGEGGEIADAFGFDLTPLVARAREIETLAQAARAEARARALLRERITLLRRDAAKMIGTGLEEGAPGPWTALQTRLAALSAARFAALSLAAAEALAAGLAALSEEVRNLLEDFVNRAKTSASESQIERHIQNQITKPIDSEPRLQEAGGGAAVDPAGGAEPAAPAGSTAPGPEPKAYPLGMVLSACPDIVDFARAGIGSWRDLRETAALVRSALGVSPDAWAQARETLGEHGAAIVIAAILQRSDEIRSAGGYLRALTAKAREGGFSPGPLLMALLRGKAAKARRERRRAG